MKKIAFTLDDGYILLLTETDIKKTRIEKMGYTRFNRMAKKAKFTIRSTKGTKELLSHHKIEQFDFTGDPLNEGLVPNNGFKKQRVYEDENGCIVIELKANNTYRQSTER